jgi:ABC-2 type transport system ATP-binding protein
MVAPLGAALHVSGSDRKAIERAIEPLRQEPWHWTEVPPSLEDVFIHLMREQGGGKAQEAA